MHYLSSNEPVLAEATVVAGPLLQVKDWDVVVLARNAQGFHSRSEFSNRSSRELAPIGENAAMGEAKRRRVALEKGPCPCGSSRPGDRCCYTGREWHKPAFILGLRSLPPMSAVERCYMKESCDGKISREHLVSESILLLLKADGDFSVSGLPWLDDGEMKIISPKSLTANCLCEKHNSALSPLDTAALYFFTALKYCLDIEGHVPGDGVGRR
jgi:hypothetical protein